MDTDIDERIVRERAREQLFGVTEETVKIGRYRIRGELGRGGLGVVYEAFDPQLHREIALKVLRSDRLSGDESEAHQARLVREAQAMAKLAHPNVIAVHDAGAEDGQVFIAMELVRGPTLRMWLNEGDHSRERILDVLLQAGEGLAAAHREGVVHRDFKPENVLVDDERVRVLDFGLARSLGEGEPLLDVLAADTLHDHTDPRATPRALAMSLTQSGAVVGTPAYMAPEQFDRKPTDARSDQFSYCVCAFEALYGERPFPGKTLFEIVAAVRGGEPVRPPGKKIPGWLDRVIARGLSSDPDERWPSMDDLLDALRSDPQRRRRRVLLGFGGAGALAAAVWALQTAQPSVEPCADSGRTPEAWSATTRAAVEETFSKSTLPYSADAWRGVAAELDEYVGAWGAMRKETCLATAVDGTQSADMLDLRMACLDRRRVELGALTRVLVEADDSVIGRSVRAASDLPAISGCADLSALKAAVPPPEDPAVAQQVAIVREAGATARAQIAAGHHHEAVAVAHAAAVLAHSVDYPPAEAEALFWLGSAQVRSEALAGAEENLTAAAWLAVRVKHDSIAARAATKLVFLLGHQNKRFDEAEQWLQQADVYVSRLGGGGKPKAVLLTNRGALRRGQGRYVEAREDMQEALAMWTKLVGPGHLRVARARGNLGNALDREGRPEEARDEQMRALEIFEKKLGPLHPDVARTVNNLANAQFSLADYDAARKNYARALEIREQVYGAKHRLVARTLANLANTADRMGEVDESLGLHEKALAVFEAVVPPDHPDLAAAHNNVGTSLRRLGRYTEAATHFEQALGIRETKLGPDHPYVAMALTSLGTLAVAERRWDDALRLHERALAIRREALKEGHPLIATSLSHLGVVRYGNSDFGAAQRLHNEALAIREQSLEPDHPDTATSLVNLADVHAALGQPEQARELYDRALGKLESTYGSDHADVAFPLVGIARLHLAAGEKLAAQPLLSRALELRSDARVEPQLVDEARDLLSRAR